MKPLRQLTLRNEKNYNHAIYCNMQMRFLSQFWDRLLPSFSLRGVCLLTAWLSCCQRLACSTTRLSLTSKTCTIYCCMSEFRDPFILLTMIGVPSVNQTQWTVGWSWNNMPYSIARVVKHKPRERSSVVKARNTAPRKKFAVGWQVNEHHYLQFLKNLIQILVPLIASRTMNVSGREVDH